MKRQRKQTNTDAGSTEAGPNALARLGIALQDLKHTGTENMTMFQHAINSVQGTVELTNYQQVTSGSRRARTSCSRHEDFILAYCRGLGQQKVTMPPQSLSFWNNCSIVNAHSILVFLIIAISGSKHIDSILA